MQDHFDASPGIPNLLDQILVTRPVQHHHGDIVHVLFERPGYIGNVRLDGCADVDRVGCCLADRDLLHIHDAGRSKERATFGNRHNRDRAGHAFRQQGGAFHRVDGDIDVRRRAVAQLLADIQHGRLVLLAFADHDHTVHVNAVQCVAHRIDRRLVGPMFIATAHPPTCPQRGRLGGTYELEANVALNLHATSL